MGYSEDRSGDGGAGGTHTSQFVSSDLGGKLYIYIYSLQSIIFLYKTLEQIYR